VALRPVPGQGVPQHSTVGCNPAAGAEVQESRDIRRRLLGQAVLPARTTTRTFRPRLRPAIRYFGSMAGGPSIGSLTVNSRSEDRGRPTTARNIQGQGPPPLRLPLPDLRFEVLELVRIDGDILPRPVRKRAPARSRLTVAAEGDSVRRSRTVVSTSAMSPQDSRDPFLRQSLQSEAL